METAGEAAARGVTNGAASGSWSVAIDDADRHPPPGRLTFEEFLDWLDEDTWAEWVDGEVVILSPASLIHQRIADFLVVVFTVWNDAHDLGTFLSAPFLIRLPARLRRGREPDIIYISAARRHLLKPTYLDGAPDLIVEIVSPDSVERDRVHKFDEYQRAGVLEYWLIDGDHKQADFYQVGADRKYRLAFSGSSGTYTSPTLHGLQLPVEWLWQDRFPKVQDLLRHFGISS